MKHILILYYILSFISGISAIVLFSVFYLKYKFKLIKQYLIFLSIFTLYILLNTFSLYIFSIAEYRKYELSIKLAIGFFIIIAGYYIFIPKFFHDIAETAYTKTKRIIFIILAALNAVFVIIPFIIKDNVKDRYLLLRMELIYIAGAILIVTAVYFLIFFIIHYKNIENRYVKRVLKNILILSLIFLPGFIIDAKNKYYQWDSYLPRGFYFTTGYYLAWNILSIVMSVKYFFQQLPANIINNLSNNFIQDFYISPREKEIIKLYIKPMHQKEIAKILFISPKTVKNHIFNVYKKTKVNNRDDLIRLIEQSG